MKKCFLLGVALLFGTAVSFAQDKDSEFDFASMPADTVAMINFLNLDSIADDTDVIANDIGNFKLYPTENFYTFLKLNTQTGQVYQLQYSVGDGDSGEWTVNDKCLNLDGNLQNGRFELYPTHNMYNFLLLDKKTGSVFQVQWAMNEKNRGLVNWISVPDDVSSFDYFRISVF